MSTKEKTYTFRAPEGLTARARGAFETWQRLLGPDAGLSETELQDAMGAFTLSVVRHARAFDEFENQSALIRATFELFVEATEKAVEDREFVRAYEEWAEEDAEGRAFRKGALEAAASRWRDE